MSKYAILKEKEVVPVDFHDWAKWYEDNHGNRHVANEEINGARISTVFLAIDHGWDGVPLWFETMIFGGPYDGYQDRYPTWEEALMGHHRAMEMVNDARK